MSTYYEYYSPREPDSATVDYYERNADAFIERTVRADISSIQRAFLRKLPRHAYILDFGCGSGGDIRYFTERGHKVDAIDASAKMCEAAARFTGAPVKQMDFRELEAEDKYDAIWACASLLHLTYSELMDVLLRMRLALHKKGLLYASFKYGDYEGARDSRFFLDMTEDRLQKVIDDFPGYEMDKLWVTKDARPDREDERWINMFVRKRW